MPSPQISAPAPAADELAEVTPDAPAPGGPERTWPRRSVLVGSGAALLACAACGSGNSTTTATSSSSSAAGTSTGATALAKVTDIPANSGLIVTAPSGQLVLATSGGKVVAHTAVCTHQGGIIDGAGICPLHGSQFNVVTGAVINGPATEPLAAVSVKESGGEVFPA